MPPGWFPLTHLWFLYELLLLYVAVIALRAMVVRFDGAQKLRNLRRRDGRELDPPAASRCSRSASPWPAR